MNIYLDIETIPTDRAAVRDYIAATITPPGTMKKAETIAAWVKDDKPAAIEEAVNRTSCGGSGVERTERDEPDWDAIRKERIERELIEGAQHG